MSDKPPSMVEKLFDIPIIETNSIEPNTAMLMPVIPACPLDSSPEGVMELWLETYLGAARRGEIVKIVNLEDE